MGTQAPRVARWRLRSSERRRLLILGDLLVASAAALAGLVLWAQLDWLGFTLDFLRARASWFVLLPLGWVLLMVNLYDLRRAASLRQTFQGVLLAAGGGVVIYMAVYFSSEPGSLPRRGVVYFLVLVILSTLLWRWVYIRIFTAPAFLRRVLIVGAGQGGEELLSVVEGMWQPPFFIIGIVDDDPSKLGRQFEGHRVLGDNRKLLDLIEAHGISDIIVTILGPMNGEMFQALLDAQQRGVEITRMPSAYEDLLGRVPIKYLESDWLLRSFVDEIQVTGTYLLFKRLLDIAGSLLGLLVLGLTFPWIALVQALETRGPVLYAQERLGQGGRSFKIRKFRTMHPDAEADGMARWADDQSDPRMTRVGRFLRKTHLDEFPQFWNVLNGEMSIVGPRPERPEFVSELEDRIPFYRARLLVKPGISGWAQVNGGKGASLEGTEEKLEYDLYYIKHRGIWMDLWIILRSIGATVGLRGV